MFPNIQALVIAFIATALLSGGVGYHFGNNKYVAFKAETTAVAEVKKEEVKQEIKSRETITSSIVTDYNAVRGGLRLNADGGGLRPVSKATEGIDARTPNEALVDECKQTTIQLIYLQKWVNEQYELK